jgi:capsular exopolysaccharide synthesis family protein
MVPAYYAESRIEIRQTGAAAPTSGDSFVATQAQLLASTALRRQAVARLRHEQPNVLYRAADRLAGLRHKPLAAYLPPVDSTPEIPAQVEVTTYGAAHVLAIQVRSTDPHYSAQLANALASEYMALGGNPAEPAAPASATTEPWVEASARFVDRAEVPDSPVNPPGRTRAVWGALAGLVVGLAAVASRGSQQASRVRGPGDIRSRLDMRELGAIPWAGSVPDPIPGNPITGNALWDAAFGRQTNRRIAPAETAVWKDEASLLAESFRSATTSLLLVKDRASRPQVITVTSAHRGEGKTTVVLNLGAALADLNLKVLVVDADLRAPRLHQILGLPNSWGLSDLLQERIPLRDVPVEALVRSCSIPNLSVVCSGPPTLNVASLLYSDRMEELMGRFRREFDVILIDTPPALMLSDARLAARLSDTVVMVIKAGETTDAEAGQLRQRLAEDGIPLAGALLNGWRCHETPEGERLAGVRHV